MDYYRDPYYPGTPAPSEDPRDPRLTASMEHSGPAHCHMASSFYNILQSSGLTDSPSWQDRQPAYTTDAAASASTGGSQKRDKPSSSTSSSSKSHRSSKQPLRKRDRRSKDKDAKADPHKKSSRSGHSKRREGEPDDEYDDDDDLRGMEESTSYAGSRCGPLDAELNMLARQLMQRSGG